MSGSILVVSGPSGSGKTSLTRQICTDPLFYLSISTTTRAPRGNERHGVEYYFTTKDQFLLDVENGLFLEWAEVHGNFYGTRKREIEEALAEGKLVVFDIDVQGHRAVRDYYGSLVSSVFVTTPSLGVLKERLGGRGTDREEVIKERLINALIEMSHIKEYDYLLINDRYDEALRSLHAIALASRNKQRVADMGEFITQWKNR
ncbi:MAG: guanylate kinase [Campylobacterales bacterium]